MEFTESFAARFPRRTLDRYEMLEVREATAVLSSMCPGEFDEIAAVLAGFELERTDIITAKCYGDVQQQ